MCRMLHIVRDVAQDGRDFVRPCGVLAGCQRPRISGLPATISGSCSSARIFAPRFLQTSPRGETLALRYP